MEDPSTASQYYEQGVAIGAEEEEEHRDCLASLAMIKARAHLKRGELEPALPWLDKAIKSSRDNAQAYFARCQCHLGLHRLDDAERDLELFRQVASGSPGRARSPEAPAKGTA